MERLRPESHPPRTAPCLSRTASSPRPSSETNFSTGPWPAGLVMPKPTEATFLNPTATVETSSENNKLHPNLELQLSTSTNTNTSNLIDEVAASLSRKKDQNHSTQLQLSIGSSEISEKGESNRNSSPKESSNSSQMPAGAGSAAMRLQLQEQAREHLRIAMAEKAYAEEARKQAKRQIELAEQEFTNAKRIRQKAQSELDKAYALKEHAIKQINSTVLHITCHACQQQFQAKSTSVAHGHAAASPPPDENSLVLSYMSSVITTEGGEVENDHGKTINS